MRAEQIARALGGRRSGIGWMARCPAHDDRVPSLAIAVGPRNTVLVHCHAGCSQRSVLDALRRAGLWDNLVPGRVFGTPSQVASDGGGRREHALRIWRDSLPTAGTPASWYLAGRGITFEIPERLRFHPALRHPSGSTWPAMVALVTRGGDDEPVGLHRTFLARDGSTKAPVDPQKMMIGPCRGGAVRLGGDGRILSVGEGIESCLSVLQATGMSAWAALSTSGLIALGLPREIEEVIILADSDGPGMSAAQRAAARWVREGRSVRIACPPTAGQDFNDMLMTDRTAGLP